LDISDFPTRHNYGLGMWQNQIERVLTGWVGEMGVPIFRGREVTGFAQNSAGVDVALSDGKSLRARDLVGCDGGRSLVRKAAGIEFPGWDPTMSNLIAEVELAEEPRWGGNLALLARRIRVLQNRGAGLHQGFQVGNYLGPPTGYGLDQFRGCTLDGVCDGKLDRRAARLQFHRA
jgi:2-polyprenyl-6-methoxyphenol hydroxylase-like FAD-dependent oxidoreductase